MAWELMVCSMEVFSTDQGSTFTITLPAVQMVKSKVEQLSLF